MVVANCAPTTFLTKNCNFLPQLFVLFLLPRLVFAYLQKKKLSLTRTSHVVVIVDIRANSSRYTLIKNYKNFTWFVATSSSQFLPRFRKRCNVCRPSSGSSQFNYGFLKSVIMYDHLFSGFITREASSRHLSTSGGFSASHGFTSFI